MRISDWSSDVCSSDLGAEPLDVDPGGGHGEALALGDPDIDRSGDCIGPVRRSEQRIEHGDIVLAVPVEVTHGGPAHPGILEDRKSVVSGKSVSVRVDPGDRRIIKKKTTHKKQQ